jgi:hypothetical protein
VIRSKLHDQPITLPTIPSHLTTLVYKQTLIGWDQIFLGRFVNEWQDIQDTHLHNNPPENHQWTGQTWLLGLISLLWKHQHNNWTERNQTLHGIDATQQEQAKRAQAQREITLIYTLRTRTLPCDRFMFYPSIQEHFDKEPSSRQLRQWIETWHPVILTSVQRRRQLGLTGIPSIRQFFTPRQ